MPVKFILVDWSDGTTTIEKNDTVVREGNANGHDGVKKQFGNRLYSGNVQSEHGSKFDAKCALDERAGPTKEFVPEEGKRSRKIPTKLAESPISVVRSPAVPAVPAADHAKKTVKRKLNVEKAAEMMELFELQQQIQGDTAKEISSALNLVNCPMSRETPSTVSSAPSSSARSTVSSAPSTLSPAPSSSARSTVSSAPSTVSPAPSSSARSTVSSAPSTVSSAPSSSARSTVSSAPSTVSSAPSSSADDTVDGADDTVDGAEDTVERAELDGAEETVERAELDGAEDTVETPHKLPAIPPPEPSLQQFAAQVGHLQKQFGELYTWVGELARNQQPGLQQYPAAATQFTYPSYQQQYQQQYQQPTNHWQQLLASPASGQLDQSTAQMDVFGAPSDSGNVLPTQYHSPANHSPANPEFGSPNNHYNSPVNSPSVYSIM